MKYKALKIFIERNGKVRQKGDTFDMTDIVANFYVKNGYIAPVEVEKKEQEPKKESTKGKKNAKKNT